MHLRRVRIVGVVMGAMVALVLVGVQAGARAMFMGMLVLMRMLVFMMMPVGVRVGLLTMQVFVLMLMLVLMVVDVPVLVVSLHCLASRGVVSVTIYKGNVLTAKILNEFSGSRGEGQEMLAGDSVGRADRYR